jgi:hypothetical protein
MLVSRSTDIAYALSGAHQLRAGQSKWSSSSRFIPGFPERTATQEPPVQPVLSNRRPSGRRLQPGERNWAAAAFVPQLSHDALQIAPT